MKIQIPKTFLGVEIEGSMERVLSQEKQQPIQIPTNSKQPDKNGFIYVPAIKLYVAKEKTLHGKDWYQTHKELHKQNLQMLTIPQYFEFIDYLKQNKNSIQEAEQILDEMLAKRDPGRAEWLDADFKVINKNLCINYNHRTINNKLTPQNSERLEDCIMKDSYVAIEFNKQGLPIKKSIDSSYIQDKNIYYWYPRSDNNSVARFYANSVRAFLDCDRNPSFSNSSLGVRVAKSP